MKFFTNYYTPRPFLLPMIPCSWEFLYWTPSEKTHYIGFLLSDCSFGQYRSDKAEDIWLVWWVLHSFSIVVNDLPVLSADQDLYNVEICVSWISIEILVAKYVYVYTCLDRSPKPVRLKTIESKIKLQILVEIWVAVMALIFVFWNDE